MSFSQINFETVRRNDRDTIEALKKIVKESGKSCNSIQISFLGGIPQHNVAIGELENDQLLTTLLAEESYVIQSFRLEFGNNLQLSISRNQNVLDQVSINPGGEKDKDSYLLFIAKVRKHLTAFDSASSVSAILGEQGKLFHAAREANLAKLEGITTSLVDDARKYRQTIDHEFAEKVKTSEEQVKAKIKELELAHEQKLKRLEEQENELKEKAKSLDDRESRHVRRELYKAQKQKFQEIGTKFSLTKGTGLLRLPIHIFSILLLVALGLFEWSLLNNAATQANTENSVWISLLIRQFVVAAAFGATAVFYLKWANRWFEQHAQEEFRLKRLDIDIDRASWLVETAMEWKDLKGAEMPESLIGRLSKNLFDSPYSEEPTLHPVDQLASQLIGASAEVELPLGKGRISLDRKGIKGLKKVENS